MSAGAMPPKQEPAALLRRLGKRRFLARAAILFERVWPALWPAWAVTGLFLCAALLNLPTMLPGPLHAALLALVVLAIGMLLIRGLWRVRLPDDTQADRRLELRSGLSHRPLSLLTDRPAGPDAVGLALWQAHTARILAQFGALRVGLPRPLMARRDPRALRLGLALALLTSLVIAGPEAPERIAAALRPTLPVLPGAAATELQAWITPPAYTRLAPVFLKPGTASVSVPAGSRLTVDVSGSGRAPSMALNDRTIPFHALDSGSFQAEWDLMRGGMMSVSREGSPLAAWTLTVVADQPPAVSWGDKPGRGESGQQTRLPWQASDDYGVTSLKAELHLRDRPDADPLIVSIPVPNGTTTSAHGVSQPDLTAHPWAGLPVIGHLIAGDAAGQTGTSADAMFEIAERPFHNPVAKLLIAARKTLTLHPADRTEALEVLDGLMQRPDLFAQDYGAFLALSAIYYDLVRNHADAAVPEAQATMWSLALHMEEGQSEQSARTLEEARQAARDAMDRAQQDPSAANREDLAKKLEELRQAIDRHIQALIEEAQRNNDIMPFDPKALRLTDRDLERMARDAQDAARQGRMKDAQNQMSQLEKMLDRLRNAHGQQGDKQANSKRQRGRNQQSAVQDMIAREGGLLDHAQQRGAAVQPQDPAAQRQADGRMQQALRRALGELMQQFTDLTGEVAPSLGEADQAMRDAQTRLNQGNDESARQEQQKAIAALQKGNREMGQAMAKQQQQSGGQPGEGEEGEDGDQDGNEGAMGMMAMPDDGRGDGRANGPIPGSPQRADSGHRDPLGRSTQGSSADNDEVEVPEERERQRTQAIQEELRNRQADQARPRQELNYIDRLLKQF